MQNYIALRVNVNPCTETATDLLAAFLGDIGYESFTSDENGLTAYIKKESFSSEAVEEILDNFPMDSALTFSYDEIEGEDWNEEWEKNYFQPIVIEGKVVVHSSFHKNVPKAEYDIMIDPKMAFGTGHHSTTSQMMSHIVETDLKDKTVIDMGTGTGILAILSKMRGAKKVFGIEIDPFAWENAVENVKLNNVDVEMICGDASALSKLSKADIFLANINRNIIINDIERYSEAIKKGGILLLSGFYEEDIPLIMAHSSKLGFKLEKSLIDNNWAAIRLVKLG